MLPLVLRSWPEARLQIVGQGPDRAALERLADDHGVSAHVQFLGFRRDVDQLLRQADLFVSASWIEGFSLVIAEANAVGLPVVTVDLPVTRETAPPRSVVLVPRDAVAFANAVVHVLDDLDTFRRAAREESQAVRERFSVDAYVQGTEAVYAEALEMRVLKAASSHRMA
jgi:glycosyltransferase involved in cell wall biosynthesis